MKSLWKPKVKVQTIIGAWLSVRYQNHIAMEAEIESREWQHLSRDSNAWAHAAIEEKRMTTLNTAMEAERREWQHLSAHNNY